MKIITPIRFEGIMQSGGSTKPWQVTAIDMDSDKMEEVSYVVKVFTKKHIQQGYSIAKEFVCNALAGQFDLMVPEVCLIDLNDSDFKATLPDGARDVLASRYQGKTFASRLVNGSIVNEQVRASAFNINDCALLFAFDCLVLNSDRGGYRNKPNLLVDEDGFILIDHELTLHIIDDNNEGSLNIITESLHSNNWPRFYEKHIFYGLLKDYRGSKKALFDTFEESLRTLDINHIENFVIDLVNNGVEVGASALLINYLRTLKQNAHQFRNILLELIA